MNIRAGTTSLSMNVQLFDDTNGSPKTGLTFESTGINISYARAGAARVAVTEITLASASAAYDSGGFVKIDDTNMPGTYRFDVPDAAIAAGVSIVTIYFICTGVRSKAVEINLSMVGESEDALTAINLDHLMKEPVADSDVLAEVVDDTVLANIMTKTDGDTSDFNFATDSLEAIRDSQTTLGAGAITFTYTVLQDDGDGDPIADVTVWVSTNSAGTAIVASGTTDASGEIIFYLDSATYYLFRQKSGYNFTNPDTEIVA